MQGLPYSESNGPAGERPMELGMLTNPDGKTGFWDEGQATPPAAPAH